MTMDVLLSSMSDLLTKVAEGASTFCMLIFFEPEVPKSLREE